MIAKIVLHNQLVEFEYRHQCVARMIKAGSLMQLHNSPNRGYSVGWVEKEVYTRRMLPGIKRS